MSALPWFFIGVGTGALLCALADLHRPVGPMRSHFARSLLSTYPRPRGGRSC